MLGQVAILIATAAIIIAVSGIAYALRRMRGAPITKEQP